VRVNEPVADDVFKVNFPAGTLVHDMWSGASYVAGEQSSPPGEKGLFSTDQRVLNQLETPVTQASAEDPTPRYSSEDAQMEKQLQRFEAGLRSSKRERWILPASGGALLAATLVAVAIWRHKRKAERSSGNTPHGT